MSKTPLEGVKNGFLSEGGQTPILRHRRALQGRLSAVKRNPEHAWISPGEFLPGVIMNGLISTLVDVTDGQIVCKAYWDYVHSIWVICGTYAAEGIGQIVGWRAVDWMTEQYARKVGA